MTKLAPARKRRPVESSLTLGDLLAEETLGLKLISGGNDALRRPVAGVHTVEIDEPSRWLAADWIMLTTGVRLRGHRDAQRALTVELDQAGVCALGFGIELAFKNVPRPLLEEAHARSFPIFTVPFLTPFREVATFVSHGVLNTELRTYQRLSAMHRYLMDGLKEEQPARVIAERVAEFANSVVIEFGADGRVELATGAAPAEALWQEIGARGEGPCEFDAAGWHAIAVPVPPSGEPCRWLVVASRASSFTNKLARPAAQAAAPLLTAITRLGDLAREQERTIRGALLAELLSAEGHRDARQLAARAASFGLDFSTPASIVVFERLKTARPSGTTDWFPLLDRLQTLLDRRGLPCLISTQAAAGIAFVQGERRAILAILEELLETETDTLVGLGRSVTDIRDVHDSLRDAQIATKRLAYDRGRRLLDFEDFDLGALLISEAPPDRIRPKVEEFLAPLRANPALREAVAAYLEHDLDITRTAKTLHLHPNSLRYRLARFEKLVGRPLRRPSTIAALYVALIEPAHHEPGDTS